MRGYTKAVLGNTNNKEGFTLIELLVVIGIIVALAANTVPLVTKFAVKGNEGAREAVTQTVQTAMDTRMTGNGITTVTANDKTTAEQSKCSAYRYQSPHTGRLPE